MQQLKEQKLLFSKTKTARQQFTIEYQIVWSEGLWEDKRCLGTSVMIIRARLISTEIIYTRVVIIEFRLLAN